MFESHCSVRPKRWASWACEIPRRRRWAAIRSPIGMNCSIVPSECAAHGPALTETAEHELHTGRPSQEPLTFAQEATDMRLFLVLPERRLILVELVEDPDALLPFHLVAEVEARSRFPGPDAIECLFHQPVE